MSVVEVVRVPSMPHGTTVLIDDDPTRRTVWLLEGHITAEGARAFEAFLDKDERHFTAFAQLMGATCTRAVRVV